MYIVISESTNANHRVKLQVHQKIGLDDMQMLRQQFRVSA